MQKIIEIKGGVARHPDYRLAAPLDFELFKGEHLAICGPNGGGKTLLVDILRSAHPLLGEGVKYDFGDEPGMISDRMQYVAFKDAEGEIPGSYYQQRWNHGDSPDYPTVESVIAPLLKNGFSGYDFLKAWGLDAIWKKELHCLSSGECRKYRLCKSLVRNPKLLVLDQPYIGLDRKSHEEFSDFLKMLADKMSIVIVVSRVEDIPECITHVVHVENKCVFPKVSREAYLADHPVTRQQECFDGKKETGKPLSSDFVISLKSVTVSCLGHVLLDSLDWQVRKGECWALTGENGAGKSTLLSVVCADNPAAYSNDVTLFGRRRGRGESIWDIKRRIGYVSPELIRSYVKPLKVYEVVCSGCRDTVGLYGKPTEREMEQCRKWMSVFGIEEWAERSFLTLSSGQQRWVMLVRAFVKEPELLILDEPFQGLDRIYCSMAKNILNNYLSDGQHTLVMVTHDMSELPSCINHHLHLIKPSERRNLS